MNSDRGRVGMTELARDERALNELAEPLEGGGLVLLLAAVLLRLDHILEERLVGPDRLNLSAVVLHERGEQPEAGPARVREPRVEHGA